MVETKDLKMNKNITGRMVNFRPVFTSFCFLFCGILFAYYQVVEEKVIGWFLVAVLLLPLTLFFGTKNKVKFLLILAIMYASYLLGVLSFSLSVAEFRGCANYNGEYYVTGTVVQKSAGSEKGKIVLTNLMIDGKQEKGKLSVYLDEKDFYALDFCDKVTFYMQVKTSNALRGNYGFRAEAIADKEMYIGSKIEFYQIEGQDFRLGRFVRGKLQTALYQSMSEESAAVVSAILLGDTSGIDDGLLDNIRYGGIAHIFAVSGLHIGAVFGFCLLAFRRNRIPAPFRFVIIAAILILYGGVCGYSASVVRSMVTCLVLYGCSLLGVKYDSLESLALAAWIVFTIYPTLVFGIGAQLSFCACLGIVLLSAPMRKGMEAICFGVVDWIKYRLLKREKPQPADMFRGNTLPKPLSRQAVEKMISFLAISLAAQVGTAPVLYVSFGYLSAASLLLNCVFVPIITLYFSPLLVLVLIAACFPAIATAVLYAPNVIISALMLPFHVIDFGEGIFSAVSMVAPAFVCYYAAMIFISDKFNLPKWIRWFVVMIFVDAFAVCLAISSGWLV